MAKLNRKNSGGGQIKQRLVNRQSNTKLNVERKYFSTRPTVLLAGLIALVLCAVLTAHWPALSARATCFDDPQYLTNNLLVQNPSWTSAWRFLTEVLDPSTVEGYYQPLAMISLMLDYAMGGRIDNLTPFHVTSLSLHVINTLLVIVLLYMLFGKVWPAAMVGLLFGVHPLTVEPIPWVGERKTLLAAFFTLWSLIIYVRFTRKRNWRLYAGCLVMYVLALMSKPTATPLPALLLLLDFWPLRRLSKRSVIEKLPLFVVGGISAIITYISQSRSMAGVALPAKFGLEPVILVFCHNIIFYLYKFIWPVNLSAHYAFPEPLALSDPMLLAGVIGTCILIPLLVISLRWTRAALTGWLFFFVAILPTMQIISFTNVIACDKFAYLPSVGLLMVLTAFLGWLCRADKPVVRHVIAVIIILILAGAETVVTRRYLVHWRDTLSFHEHMLTIAPNAAPLHNNLANALHSQGRFEEAISHYYQALHIGSKPARPLNNLGKAFWMEGKLDEAVSYFRQALKIEPNDATVNYNLGGVLSEQGKLDEAIVHYKQALRTKPDFVEAHRSLGQALLAQGKSDEAADHFRQVLRTTPDDTKVRYNLGVVLSGQGRLDEAVSHFHRVLRTDPNHVGAHNNLAITLRAQGKLDEAVEHFRQALQIEPHHPDLHSNLALALASQDKLEEAISHYQQALQLKPDSVIAHSNLGKVLLNQDRLDEAIGHFRQALQIKPDYAEVHYNLGYALAQQGNLDEAIKHYTEALQIKPDFALAHYNLALVLTNNGQIDKAIIHLKETLQLTPDWVIPMNTLAWLLATQKETEFYNPEEATRLAERSCELTNYQDPSLLDTLAAAYAAAGKFSQAIETAEKALQLAESSEQKELTKKIQNRLILYKASRPYVEPLPKVSSD